MYNMSSVDFVNITTLSNVKLDREVKYRVQKVMVSLCIELCRRTTKCRMLWKYANALV